LGLGGLRLPPIGDLGFFYLYKDKNSRFFYLYLDLDKNKEEGVFRLFVLFISLKRKRGFATQDFLLSLFI